MTGPRKLQISYTIEELPKLAAQLWQWGHTQLVWAFTGDLGAGKTTLIRALCSHLGVTDAVSSPTFALVNEYQSAEGKTIYHMDWYRLHDAEEAYEAGIAELLSEPGALCLIEWPERAMELLPEHTVHVKINNSGASNRLLQAWSS